MTLRPVVSITTAAGIALTVAGLFGAAVALVTHRLAVADFSALVGAGVSLIAVLERPTGVQTVRLAEIQTVKLAAQEPLPVVVKGSTDA